MVQQTLEEWRAEAVRRFGQDATEWVFVCPRCGYRQSPGDFSAVDADPQRAYVECIGRVGLQIVGSKQPCDWAAFGFLGTMGKGRLVQAPGEEHPTEVFDFADAS